MATLQNFSFNAEDPVAKTFFAPEHVKQAYTVCELMTTWYYNSGKKQAAVAGPPGTVQAPTKARSLQVCAPYGRKTVAFTATRVVLPPTLPDPVPTDPNEVLEEATLTPSAPQLDTDGKTKIYVVSGVYEYFLLVPDWFNKKEVKMGTLPYTTVKKEMNVLTAVVFSTLLL